MKIDFRYVQIGDEVYYVPEYLKSALFTTSIIIGLASPMILLAIVAWSFM